MHIAIFITLLVISFRASKSIRTNSEILKEYKQSNILSYLVYLYPVGPLLLFINASFPLILLYPLVATCYIPQLIIANKQSGILNRAGTDRVNKAIEALSQVSLGAIIGLIYLSFVAVITLASLFIGANY